ncbi:aggregation-promoting factor C-terminal-like domain-containing protein [Microbacterium tumbae]
MSSSHDNDLIETGDDPKPVARLSAPGASAAPRARWSRRRGVVGVFASVAVVGFAAAIVAPTGIALADPVETAEAQTVFSLAAEDSQDLTVTVEGSSFAPVERGAYDVYVTPPPPEPEVASSSSGSGSSSGSRPRYTGGGSPAEWMAAAGIAESDWGYVDYIVSRESGWNPNATNSSSGACGLVQALPCSKVPGNGYNPVDNLRWGNGYAVGRYGSWGGAYNFWQSHHWW